MIEWIQWIGCCYMFCLKERASVIEQNKTNHGIAKRRAIVTIYTPTTIATI